MKFLLDTNICIYLIKRKPPAVAQKFRSYSVGDIGVSAITVAELQYGVQKSRYSEQNEQAINQMLADSLRMEGYELHWRLRVLRSERSIC